MSIDAQPSDLTLRQLQYVVAVADQLGFHKAAAACHVSQPTLSAQIQQLESVLGITLFERDRRRVLLTAAGQVVVERARRILLEVGDLLAAAARAREPFTGTLRIGVIPTIAPYLLPELTPKISAAYPKLSIIFREEKTSEVVHGLGRGELDAAIVALEAEIGDCAHAVIARDEFVAALPKGHPLSRKKRLGLPELEGARVLLLDEGHCFRQQALALCTKVRAEETDFRATSLSTLAQMVSSGAGITLLPALAVSVENRRGQLDVRPFNKPAPGRTIALVWRPRSPLSDEFALFAETLRRASSAIGLAGTKA
jgi:LysR family transcriptional regulator, hydrogen peroxide-inducible genes activator